MNFFLNYDLCDGTTVLPKSTCVCVTYFEGRHWKEIKFFTRCGQCAYHVVPQSVLRQIKK